MEPTSRRYDNSDGRLRGRAGVARRKRIWASDPCCANCGRLTDWPKGFQIDHRVPLFKGGKDEDSNLQVLCCGPGGCHDKKTAAEQEAGLGVVWFPEWLEPVSGHLTLVFGPPGSGKSAYVEQHAGKFDLVVDTDQIMSELSGLPIYHAGKEWMHRAAFLRNRMLSALSREAQKAWFVVTGRGKDERDWWALKLKPAEVIVMRTDASTCIARINADARRPEHVKLRQIEGVKKWWLAETGAMKSTVKTQFDSEGRVIW